MSELDRLYSWMLHLGFIVLRCAFDSGDQEWLRAEIELLHNVPSLLGEENVERHKYFWFQERNLYVDLMSSHGNEEALSRMRTYYEPIWKEMRPLILAMA